MPSVGRISIEKVIEPYPLLKRTPVSKSDSELTNEWLYSKNCGFGPEDFSRGSNVAVWWTCSSDADHVWQDTIKNRAIRGFGCRFCSGKRVSRTNSLMAR